MATRRSSACWAMNSGQIATGRDPVTLAARAPRRYTDWADASMTDGVLASDPLLDNDNPVEEDVKAVYFSFGVKGELGSMPTNLFIGARYESTEVTSTAQIVVPAFTRWSGMSNDDFRLDRSGAATAFSETADYNHLLPSLDFDIGLTDSVKGRFSYSKTIARADYGNCSPAPPRVRRTARPWFPSTTRAAGSSNNPALVPLESDNFDLSLEWYFSDTGYVSAGLGEKRVTNSRVTKLSSRRCTASRIRPRVRTLKQPAVPRASVDVLGRRHVAVHGNCHAAEPGDGGLAASSTRCSLASNQANADGSV